jgi:hypothetical protein
MILTHLVMLDFLPGAGDGSTPAPTPSTYAPNWLSPSIRLGVFLILCLAWDKWLT